MNVNTYDLFEQVKGLDGFPYNAVGSTWEVNKIEGKYIILKRGSIGLGVTEEELEEHFKLAKQYESEDHNVEVHEEEDEEDQDDQDEDDWEDYEKNEEYDDDSDNKQVSKFKSFLRKIGFSN